MKSFMAITYHYIDSAFEIKAGLVDFTPVVGKHTGANIAACLVKVFLDFNIGKKQVLIIPVDNATSNDSAIGMS
jgi:hypothetical protein